MRGQDRARLVALAAISGRVVAEFRCGG